MFAIVTISGKQYTVSAGDRIVVDRIEGEVGDAVIFDKVLLTSKDKETQVGTPYVAKAIVKGKIVAQEKGEKISVRRYKSKVRYRRRRGFRALETTIEIVTVG